MLDIQVRGLDEGIQALRQLRDAAGRFNGLRLAVGSPLVYAPIIETGLRGGRPWRKAGPAHYLRGAVQAVEPRLRPQIAAALELALTRGPSVIDQAMQAAGDALMEEAQRRVPVRSGRLRGSIRAIRAGRG